MARIWPPVGPQNLPQGLFDPDWHVLDLNGDAWIAATSGTGSTSQAVGDCFVSSGATAGGTAQLSSRNSAKLNHSLGQLQNSIDWSKRVVAMFIGNVDTATTNGIYRLKIGEASNDAVGDQAVAGIGLKLENLALSGIAHDDTTLDEVDLSVSVTEDTTFKVYIDSDGAGNVRFYVDTGDGSGPVLRGTSTGGPTAVSSANESGVIHEVTNGADSADYRVQFSRFAMAVKQT